MVTGYYIDTELQVQDQNLNSSRALIEIFTSFCEIHLIIMMEQREVIGRGNELVDHASTGG